MGGVIGAHAESGQSVCNDIRCGSQIFAGSGGKVHDSLDTAEHILSLPTGHCHVFHSGSSLSRGEFGLRAHLPGFIPQGVQVIPGRAGDGGDLAHALIKVCRSLYRGSAETGDSHGCGHDLLTGAGDGVSESLHLFTGLVDLRQRHTGGRCFLLQSAEFLLRLDDFPLQGVIFILTEVAVFKLLFCLLLCLLQSFQLFRRCADGIFQRPLLLGDQLGITGVKFEEAVHILQLTLGVFDRAVDILQCFFKTCGVAADLNSYALNASGHAVRLLPLEIVEILLPGYPHGILLSVLVVVVPFLRPDIQNHTNGQEIEVAHGQPDLQASEQEQRRRYLPGAGIPFFLDSMSVTRLAPHRSRISGSTW